jgi:hypothetical protein
MDSGQQFSFIVALDIAVRMDRVVLINDGQVLNKTLQAGDMVYTVEKT